MDIILNAIKCAICHEILESPVILPCSCNVCNNHVTNQSKDVIRCEKCGVEHQIASNGFQSNNALKMIIKAEIASLDFGIVHKEAKKSCESFEEALKHFQVLLKDPHFYTHERINVLKNTVQLKGDELKLRIDQEMNKLFDRLEEYEKKSKEYLSSNEIKVKSQELEKELKSHQSNLDSWLSSLNKIKLDEEKWKSIIEESNQVLKCITEKMDKFKDKLLLNKFEVKQKHVNWFKSIKFDSIFEYGLSSASRIINESSAEKLDELLKKKDLDDRNWSLLYRGSRDGFQAFNFHSHCDGKPNTLIIVKSENGNIFGGFTSAQWKSSITGLWQEDKSAFIFSLVNKENKSLLFEHMSSGINSIGSYTIHGPIFGAGNDIFISDSSNLNTSSYSNLGNTYSHPEYPFSSEKAKTILAGTSNFKVQEIEVFQMQQ